MHDADQACYAAKDLGRGRACIYSGRCRTDQRGAKSCSARISTMRWRARASACCTSRSSRSIPERTRLHTRAEILLRMIDDSGAMITPGAFLPAASRYGLMPQIDRWVIDRVFTGYPHVFMQNPELVLSLNLSAPSLNDESLAEFILQWFDQSVVKPEQICFEIAEATMSHNFAAPAA